MNTYHTPSPQQARSLQELLDGPVPLGVEVAYLPEVEGWKQWDLAVQLQEGQDADHSKG